MDKSHFHHDGAEPIRVDAQWAFERYEQLRSRLPQATPRGAAEERVHLGELMDRFDVFVFDSFGVLNVGEKPILGAADRVRMLRDAGKRAYILTNAATAPLASLPSKYESLGFQFDMDEIVSSRAILAAALCQIKIEGRWLAIAPDEALVQELGVPMELFDDTERDADGVGGILFMSSQTMTESAFDKLADIIRGRSLPLLVGNPDLVAPRVHGFSLEPGYYAHKLADELGAIPEFFGKPYPNAFDVIKKRLEPGVPHARVAMIGDTLHTDILGGAAAGFGTVLVTQHGVLKDLDVSGCISRSGISPDYILPSI